MTSNFTPHWFTATVPSQGLQVDAPADQTLLLSLEQGGANWLSSCRNGSCRTCIGKLASGSVRYEMEWPGLSSEELAENHVLPCVAYPCCDVVLEAG